MRVTINGEPQDIERPGLGELISRLGLNPLHVVAELNGQIVPRDSYDQTLLKEGDCLELLQFVGGG